MKKVKMLSVVKYTKVDDQDLHISRGETQEILNVDNVIICAGQESLKDLETALLTANQNIHVIGGANIAAQLDVKMAIKKESELAAKL
tara:strand:- start:185 stop:448 length:264 start_codon:yes stop_codon:yes gene_type:complete